MLKVDTKTSVISYDLKEGFLRVVVKANVDMEVNDARLDMEESSKLVNGKKRPVLVDGRKMTYHSKEVREYYASKEVAESISAMAIMIDSIPTRIFGNFFIKISKPHFPTRLFDDQNLAEQWLKEIVNQKYIDKFAFRK